MNHSLVLPAFAHEIPGKVEIHLGGNDMSAFALALAAEGLLTMADLHQAEHLLPVVDKAIARWINAEAKGLRFRVNLLYTDDWREQISSLQGNYEDAGGDDGRDVLLERDGAFALCISSDCAVNYLVGPHLAAIEKQVPSLGRVLLRILEQTLWETCGCYGPSEALADCQAYQWGGERDHHMRMEEYRAECDHEFEPVDLGQPTGDVLMVFSLGGHPEDHGEMTLFLDPAWNVQTLWLDCLDLEDAIITKEHFHSHLPEWACEWRHQKPLPTPENLRAAVTGHRIALHLRTAVHACANLLEVYRREKPRSEQGLFYAIAGTISPLVMSWLDTEDMVARMYDDRANMAAQSGEGTEVRNIWLFDKADPKGCRRAIREIRKVLKVLHAAQTALQAVSSKIYY